MRGYVVTSYGKTLEGLQLQARAILPPGPGQVAIEVQAVAVNPVDLKTLTGESKLILPFAPPFVLGVDLVGQVTAVGAEVRGLSVGDQVYGYLGMDAMGAFAEQVVVDAWRVARTPPNQTPEVLACLPLPGLCALQALDAGAVKRGSRVLIHGGLGGVGAVAVQLARARGAEIFATVGQGDVEEARSLGVHHPIAYQAERFEQVARELDLVFDTVGGETLKRSWAVVRRGGVLASLHLMPSVAQLRDARLSAGWLVQVAQPLMSWSSRRAARLAGAALVPILTVPARAGLETLSQQVDAGGIRVRIDRVFAFEALPLALEHARSGKARGRVVVVRA